MTNSPETKIPDPLVSLTAPLAAEHKRVFDFMLKSYLEEFGPAESSKQHAAARLAGLLVVAAALGELPHSIIFHKTQDLPIPFWESGAIWSAEYLNVLIDQNTDSLMLLKSAMHLHTS